ncbi:MAG: 30S ribosomal protein S5 [Pyramidobacter sp.]|jgi:small subunit ribosomal protein S5|nr:30S ribosomal protein S5 [Synergistaceae bacterium]MBP3752670.1 30S ribosomal protein S5 [Pyramidobacter sp.]MBP3835953.1 30S ribosomal protein S5 [Pyramidobacter sp.]MBP3848358.1 30S ribosomal protein S5 [Pyramidobacter sp.]MBQ4491116.1 30S ribosomal protein S5 [Pyramidobacter sp.]
MTEKQSASGSELNERVIFINRVSKTVKGGKRFRFSILLAVGDGEGNVGIGMGKAREISEAVRKGMEDAKKDMLFVKRNGNTIPHPVLGRYGSAAVLLRPAVDGTGVIAGSVVRAIMELGGIKDVMTKVVGRTSNPVNVARATLAAVAALRTHDEIMALRGKKKENA